MKHCVLCNASTHTNKQFGGKLVSFSNTRGAGVPKTVAVSQVVTEQEFLRRSCDLEKSLSEGKLAEFCDGKVGECADATEKSMWSFLKVSHMS